MSKHETPITRWYWRQVGGLLIEEFPLIRGSSRNAPRFADALIVVDESTRIAESRNFDIEGRDVIVVQSKAKRLGMSLMGQCLFSLDLVNKHRPRSAESVAICIEDDTTLRPFLEAHEGCRVVIFPGQTGEG